MRRPRHLQVRAGAPFDSAAGPLGHGSCMCGDTHRLKGSIGRPVPLRRQAVHPTTYACPRRATPRPPAGFAWRKAVIELGDVRGRVGGLWGARAGRRLNCRVQAYQWPGSSGAEESRTGEGSVRIRAPRSHGLREQSVVVTERRFPTLTVTTQAAQRAVPFNRMGARRTTATPVGPATASPGSPRLPPNRPPTPT